MIGFVGVALWPSQSCLQSKCPGSSSFWEGGGLQPLTPLFCQFCNMIAYPNRNNTFCTHPPQPTLGWLPSHIPWCATHPAMHSGHIPLLPLLFGSLASRPAVGHVQFAFHKSRKTRVCKNVTSKIRADVGMVQCVQGMANHKLTVVSVLTIAVHCIAACKPAHPLSCPHILALVQHKYCTTSRAPAFGRLLLWRVAQQRVGPSQFWLMWAGSNRR